MHMTLPPKPDKLPCLERLKGTKICRYASPVDLCLPSLTMIALSDTFSLLLLALLLPSVALASEEHHTIQLSARKSYGLAKRHSTNRTVPLGDFFNGTDLQWFGNISG
jgi:hypothetical protein